MRDFGFLPETRGCTRGRTWRGDKRKEVRGDERKMSFKEVYKKDPIKIPWQILY